MNPRRPAPICTLSDQELSALYPPPPGHKHNFGPGWFTADPRPGVISNRYKRICRCGHIDYGRGDAWGREIRLERAELTQE